MKTRIEKLIDKEQLTPSKLADLIGVQRSSISHILSGRNNPSLDFVQKILLQFKNLNSDWLLFGKGEMYKTAQPSLFEITKKTAEENIEQKTQNEQKKVETNVNDSVEKNVNNTNSTKEEKIISEEKQQDKIKEEQKIEEKEENQKVSSNKKIDKKEKNIQTEKPEKFVPIPETKETDISQPEQIVIFFDDKTFSAYRPRQ